MTEHMITAARRQVGAALRLAVAGLAFAALAGCVPAWQTFQPGADASQVTTRLGPPKEVYKLANGNQRLMWPTQPLGETTVVAEVDPSGKVVWVRQVLSNEDFYKAEIGKWTQHDVLVNFGKPGQTGYFPLTKRVVWTYRYMDSGVWYMMYNFYFDTNGTLVQTQKTPDPLHDQEHHLFM
jgi:hypothetical protein